MLRSLYRGREPGLTLGIMWYRWSDGLVFNATTKAWEAVPTAPDMNTLIAMAPVAASGPLADLYRVQTDTSDPKLWLDGLYVGLVWNKTYGVFEDFTVAGELHAGDDAPVFPGPFPPSLSATFTLTPTAAPTTQTSTSATTP